MKIILLYLLLTALTIAQEDVILKLFPGKWKMETDKAEIYEEWKVVEETELVGKSYSVDNSVDKVSEILYLKKFGDQWAYVAVPEGQNISLFALVEYTPKKFIFENKEHDFPNRISYEFHKGGKLTAAIEGEVDGEFKRIEFSFMLIEE
jgi:hypothetical protein